MDNPVLLLHGFTTSAQRTWIETGWTDLLADAGREVIAPDMLGHGSAARPHDPAAYDIERQISDLLPEGPIDAVGYSAGARVLLSLASQQPSRFDRIVAAGVGAGLLAPQPTNRIIDAIEETPAAEDVVASRFASMSRSDGNDPKALAAFMRRSQPVLGQEQLALITAKTMVIAGSEDFAGPVEPLAEAIPKAKAVTLQGVDHFGLPKSFKFLEIALNHLDAAPF